MRQFKLGPQHIAKHAMWLTSTNQGKGIMGKGEWGALRCVRCIHGPGMEGGQGDVKRHCDTAWFPDQEGD